MGKLRKAASALGALAIASGGIALVTASPAAAGHGLCGSEITANYTLTADIGPCTGNGLIVTANGVDLNLNGYTVFMEDNGVTEDTGILLDGVRNVRVHGGSVTGFDAGVGIEFGSRNRVYDMNVYDNVNDFEEPVDPSRDDLTPEEIASVTCDLGDGIAVFMSPFNIVEDNTVSDNGPYGGITVIGPFSDNNLIRDNTAEGNNVPNLRPDELATEWAPIGTPGMCGGTEIGTPGMSRGRGMQAVGIRVEGPGANRNVVRGNDVADSGLVGISIHSTVKIPASDEVMPQPPNTNNVISNNDVTTTGINVDDVLDTFADGIGILASGPIGTVTEPGFNNTISNNKSYGNERNGILLGVLTFGNRVTGNLTYDNACDGIRVNARAYGNTLTGNVSEGNAVGPCRVIVFEDGVPVDETPVPAFDASDESNDLVEPPVPPENLDAPGEPCENNWFANTFGTVNDPVCVE